MCIHIIPSLVDLLPTTAHHPSRSSQSTELSSLGWVPISFQLAIYFTHGHVYIYLGSPCGSAGKESACSAGDLGLIPGLGRSPEEVKGYPLQYSGVENSMDRIVHGVAKSRTQLSNWTELSWYTHTHTHTHTLALVVKNLPANAGDLRGAGLIPGSGRHPGGGTAMHSILLPGKSHGQRSLVGYSPWGCKELDTTERLTFSFLHCVKTK